MCCSQYGYYGTSNAYCGQGCIKGCGSCSGGGAPSSSRRSSSSSIRHVRPHQHAHLQRRHPQLGPLRLVRPAVPQVAPVRFRRLAGVELSSTDRPAKGSQYGNCCSQDNWCGRIRDHCYQGCQPGFGTCSGQPSASIRLPISSSSQASSSLSRTVSLETSSLSSTSETSNSTNTASTSMESDIETSTTALPTIWFDPKNIRGCETTFSSVIQSLPTPTSDPDAAFDRDLLKDPSIFTRERTSDLIDNLQVSDADAHFGESFMRIFNTDPTVPP